MPASTGAQAARPVPPSHRMGGESGLGSRYRMVDVAYADKFVAASSPLPNPLTIGANPRGDPRCPGDADLT